MREMGSREGYDPMPPSQHTWFLDVDEAETSRAIAWVWSKTIRPGRGKKRTAYAADERGKLTLKHAAADLGWELPNAHRAFSKLEQQGRIRRDEKGYFWLRGDVPEPQRRKDEDEKEVICTDNLPEGLRLYFEQHPKKESLQADYAEIQRYRKRIEADAIALARAQGDDIEQQWYAAIGYREERKQGRPRLDRENLAIQLELTALPELSVQITTLPSVQNGNCDSHKSPNDFVQKTPSLLESEDQRSRVSEWDPPPSPNPSTKPIGANADAFGPLPPEPTPPTTPPTENQFQKVLESNPDADPLEASSAIVRSVQHFFGRKLGAKDPLRQKFETLGKRHGVPDGSILRFLGEKFDRWRAKRYTVETPGALLQIAEDDLPGWIKQKSREIDSDRQWEEANARKRAAANEDEGFDPLSYNRQLKELASKKGMS